MQTINFKLADIQRVLRSIARHGKDCRYPAQVKVNRYGCTVCVS
jgi:hypothetical protein